jgi:hypothetical protein
LYSPLPFPQKPLPFPPQSSRRSLRSLLNLFTPPLLPQVGVRKIILIIIIIIIIIRESDSMSMCPNRQNSEKGVRLHRDRVQGWPSAKKSAKAAFTKKKSKIMHGS